ncbi:MAG: Kelch repeat type 2-containing protein [Bacteroidota bacterium]|nr:Kelch repeat type 2-containing protein [Bacteroidota bacterium]
MKVRLYSLAIILGLSVATYAQSGQWVWMKGDSTTRSAGNYGTVGVPSPSNEPPARFSPAFWTDTAGNFWMYGGTEYDTSNVPVDFWDLWKFDPLTTMWTWMNGPQVNIHDPRIPVAGTSGHGYYDRYSSIAANKGVYSIQNFPGSIGNGVPTWVTSDNHLWFYGGQLYDTTAYQTNLWQYDPISNQWAWMGNFAQFNYGVKGAGDTTTSPGRRWGGNSSWVNAGRELWLFSCLGFNGAGSSDMWKYDGTTGIWTWMSGSATPYDTGVYGIKGIPSINNYPWNRNNNFFWKDGASNFWMAGGLNINNAPLQDVWKFNPQTLEWTWSGGQKSPDHEINMPPTGALCDSSYLNRDGDRFWNRTVWKVCDDLILNYGGATNPGVPYYNCLNDVWGYLPSIDQWIKLADEPNTGYKHYGTKGVANSANYPSARHSSVGFVDKQGGLWMFGGENQYYASFNDLWKFTIDTACLPVAVCNLKTAINVVPTNSIGITLSPNPASDFSILTLNDFASNLNGILFDISGREIETFKITSATTQIPFANLPSGLYFLKVSDGLGHLGVGKLVKE